MFFLDSDNQINYFYCYVIKYRNKCINFLLIFFKIALSENIKLDKITKENIKIYYTNAILMKLSNLKENDKKIFIKEMKDRKMYNNIKIRNIKQLIKKIILNIDVNLYFKLK